MIAQNQTATIQSCQIKKNTKKIQFLHFFLFIFKIDYT